MRKLLLICLLLAFVAPASAGPQDMLKAVVAAKNGASAPGGDCSSCNSTNDGYVYESPNVGDNVTANTYGYAVQFTTATSKCITGVIVGARALTETETMTCEIWTDNAGSPGAIVGAGFTGSLTPLGNSGYPNNEVLFATSQELTAGTYWAYCQPDAQVNWVRDADGTGTFVYTDNGGTSFSAATSKLVISVIGCDP